MTRKRQQSALLAFMAVLALFAAPLTLHAQSIITPELMRQLRNDRTVTQQLQGQLAQDQALRNMVILQQRSAATALTPMTAAIDSIILSGGVVTDSMLLVADSLVRLAGADTVMVPYSVSVYEDMFIGRVVYPDSIIPFLRLYGYDVFQPRPIEPVVPGTTPSSSSSSVSSSMSTAAAAAALQARSQQARGQVRIPGIVSSPGVNLPPPGPGDMGGIPADYPIRPGDEVKISLWGRINEEYVFIVSREGTVNIPHNVGPVTVGGLPFSAAQRTIAERLKRIEGVSVALTMGELRPIGIYVVGEVNAPGFHTVSPMTSVTNTLFTAGGITRTGSLRKVQLRRSGRLVAEVDFYDFLMSGNDRSGLRIQAGDVIVVPVAKQVVAVAGNVRRSALYELKEPTKLADVLELAGGVSPAGWTSRVQVERYRENSYHVVLDVESTGAALPDFLVQDGDLIKVFPVLAKDRNTVHLEGNVLRPGKYGFRGGMRLRDLIHDHYDLLPETHFEYAVILRKTYPSFLDRIIAFNLGRALEDSTSTDNVELEDQDVVIIYSSDFFNPDRNVAIDGAVNTPGDYKLFDNMTVRDLILQAGGLTDAASSERGEIYRRQVDGESIVIRKIEFVVGEAMRGDLVHNVALQRSDKVFIRHMKGWEAERSVYLGGQVYYPGAYVVFENETLGDLIKRAGGFRPDAYVPAAVFTRQSVKDMEDSRMRMYNHELGMGMVRLSMQLASTGVNASALLEQQLLLREMLDSVLITGRVVIDMTDEKQYSAFMLEDGDELFIPRNLSTVSVLGEVYNATTFKLNPSKTVATHYLDIAGGMKESADKKSVYVVKANGNVISNRRTRMSSIHLEPGDVVIVPAKIRYPNNFAIFIESTEALMRIGTFLTSLVTLILAINSMNSK